MGSGVRFSGRFIAYWVPVIFWMAIIFWSSTDTFSSQNTSPILETAVRLLVPTISPPTIDVIHAIIRKTAHVAVYFVLGLLLFRAFRSGSDVEWNWRWSFFAVIWVVLWAASDEAHQSFVPTRTASAIDVGFDTAGGILAQLLIAVRYRHKRVKT